MHHEIFFCSGKSSNENLVSTSRPARSLLIAPIHLGGSVGCPVAPSGSVWAKNDPPGPLFTSGGEKRLPRGVFGLSGGSPPSKRSNGTSGGGTPPFWVGFGALFDGFSWEKGVKKGPKWPFLGPKMAILELKTRFLLKSRRGGGYLPPFGPILGSKMTLFLLKNALSFGIA